MGNYRWGVKWFNDWCGAGESLDLRVLEFSIAHDDGVAFALIVMGLGLAVMYTPDGDGSGQ